MQYDHILIRFGELSLKGKNRHQFVNQLRQNIKRKLKPFKNLEYKKSRDRLFIELHGENHEEVAAGLQQVFGIHSFSLAVKVNNDLDAMKEGALSALWEANPDAKTFKVSSRRAHKIFPINSQELNREIGGFILKNSGDSLKVDVHNPDVNVRVEVREQDTYITCYDFKGPGGLPVGSSGKVLLLLSGGIDSPVAGYLTMKRGVKLEAIHFESPPYTSERAKQKVIDLAKALTPFGGGIKLHIVPFTEVQKEINKHIPPNYSMTIMRRMMLRIAEGVAGNTNALALATGESLGQVASQTLESMNTINSVTSYPILRPLIGMDKIEIMDISRAIETYDISIRPYEDCCTVFLPSSPATRPKKEFAEKYEINLEVDRLVKEAVEGTETLWYNEEHHENKTEFEEDLF